VSKTRSLPVVRQDPLDSLEITSPCTVSWHRMKGSRSVRHCPACELNVYNISEMSREQARALIERVEGRVCLRLRRRRDGTLVTGDCWARIRAARRRGLLAAIGTTIVMLPVMAAALTQGLWSLRELIVPRVDELPGRAERLGGVSVRLQQPPPKPPPGPIVGRLRQWQEERYTMGGVVGPALDEAPGWRPVPPRAPSWTPPTPQLRLGGAQFLFRVCVDTEGRVVSLRTLRGATDADDARVRAFVQKWRYQPVEVNGAAVPFCTTARLIFAD
jgi:hypothetical protein